MTTGPLTILHLVANRWWTGSAEPVIRLSIGLRARGHTDLTVYSAAPNHELEEALEHKISAVRLFTLVGGLTGVSAGLAMTYWTSLDWPLHEGQLWPDGPLALRLHMAHRILGAVVGLITIACAIVVARAARSTPRLRRLALSVPVVVAGQIALGLAVIATMRSLPIVVGHFAGAATLWSLWMAMLWSTSRAREERPLPVSRTMSGVTRNWMMWLTCPVTFRYARPTLNEL